MVIIKIKLYVFLQFGVLENLLAEGGHCTMVYPCSVNLEKQLLEVANSFLKKWFWCTENYFLKKS